jgi:hypothetical protein
VSSLAPGERAGVIAIASKAPARMTIVGLQKQPTREFNVGYLPHEVAVVSQNSADAWPARLRR